MDFYFAKVLRMSGFGKQCGAMRIENFVLSRPWSNNQRLMEPSEEK